MSAAIVERYNLAYFAVPKAGSTSMKATIYDLEHDRPWTAHPNKVHPEYRTFPLSPMDITDTEGYFRFAIVRDPVVRLLSAYGNRVHAHRDISRSSHGRRQNLKFRIAHPRRSLLPSATDFYGHLETYQKISYSIWHHTASISNFIGSDLSVFDAVYRLESDIPLLEAELSRRARRPIRVGREQTEGVKIRFDDLPRKVRAKVVAYTSDDYSLLHSFYEPPHGNRK